MWWRTASRLGLSGQMNVTIGGVSYSGLSVQPAILTRGGSYDNFEAV